MSELSGTQAISGSWKGQPAAWIAIAVVGAVVVALGVGMVLGLERLNMGTSSAPIAAPEQQSAGAMSRNDDFALRQQDGASGSATPLSRNDDFALRQSDGTTGSAPALSRNDDFATRHGPAPISTGRDDDFALRHPELFSGSPSLSRNDDYGTRH